MTRTAPLNYTVNTSPPQRITLTLTSNILSDEIVTERKVAGWRTIIKKNAMDEKWCNVASKDVLPVEKLPSIYNKLQQSIVLITEQSGRIGIKIIFSEEPHAADEVVNLEYDSPLLLAEKRVKFGEEIKKYTFWREISSPSTMIDLVFEEQKQEFVDNMLSPRLWSQNKHYTTIKKCISR